MKCDFCGKELSKKDKAIKGQTGVICLDCVATCVKSIDLKNSNFLDDMVDEVAKTEITLNTPSEIIAFLDQYVIGQETAKEKLAVGIYNHYKMIHSKDIEVDPEVEIEKSNILLAGPTGSGKTFMIKTLAKMLGVPLAIQDATSLTSAGYVGEDVENCLRKLIEAADGDIERAQMGIVYLDEIDKNSRKGENVSITRDVSGEGVQQALLKLVEGSICEVPPKGGRKHPGEDCYRIDTTNILFIVGGSFEGIEKIIAKRVQGKSSVGFGAKIIDKNENNFNKFIDQVLPEDLKKFGMMPEFLGRFPVIASLKELDEEALCNILTEPKNALVKQYAKMLKLDDVELEITEEALKAIANKAIERKTGARGLRSIMEDILLKYMKIIPDDKTITKVIITEDTVAGKEAIIERDDSEAV